MWVYIISILFSIATYIAMAIGYKYTVVNVLLHVIIIIVILFSIIQILNEYGNTQKIINNNKSVKIVIKKNIRTLLNTESEVFSNFIFAEIIKINKDNKTITLLLNKKKIVDQKINILSLQILFSLIPEEYIENTILVFYNDVDNNDFFYFPEIYYIASTIREKNEIFNILDNIKE